MKINLSEKALKIMRIVRIIVTIIITCEIIRRFAIGQSTPHLILILLLLMAPYKIYQTHVVTRKEFESTGRGEEWRKIVIKSVILGLIIIIVFVTVVVLVAVNSNKKEIHSLDSISAYVEQEGDIYTEDRLVYLITQGYKKDELYKAWGMPTDKILNDNTDADVWILSDKQQLAIYYDKNKEVTKIEILTVTAFD